MIRLLRGRAVAVLSGVGSAFSDDISIDLGTANTLVHVQGRGVIINEPSVVAISNRNGIREVMAVGMTAVDINPRAMSYGYDRVRFVRPVFIGDTLKVRAEITSKSDHTKRPDELGMVEETVTVTNQEEQVVLVLIHVYVVEKRAAAA